MTAHAAIASGVTLGILLIALLLLVGVRNRSFVRELSGDADRGWRIVARLTAVAFAVLIAWISLFDNWRQLTALPFRATRQYPSQRIEISPASDTIRAVTFALLVVALVVTACLVARHIGGYLLQLIIALGAFVAWLPFFVIGQRFNLDLAMGFSGSWTSPADVVGYLAFVLMTWALDIGLITVSFVALLGLTALPITLVLDILRLRKPRISTESDRFFQAIGNRGQGRLTN